LRILVADDHPSVRRYVCGVLQAEEGWNVCGEADNGRQAVEMAFHLKPDVVVLDLSMPELNGLDAARQILKEIPRTGVLILTLHDGEDLTRAVLETGARACVVKTDLQCLVTAVRTLSQTDRPRPSPPFSNRPEVAQQTNGDEAFEQLLARLTEREPEILHLLAQSRTNKEIATALSMSLKNVETCRATIMRTLEVDSVVDLVRLCLRKRRPHVKP
jgi:DNA-binding NarL/FixJ family response regulator